MASPIDRGELWHVGTRESKRGSAKQKYENALVTYTVTESCQMIRIK